MILDKAGISRIETFDFSRADANSLASNIIENVHEHFTEQEERILLLSALTIICKSERRQQNG